ncbi:MFS transporter [Microaerobacter geothermalis]|uniref:MDR family MFS transporter n=1 Tax=Microaerobacter geothermalis TaxID=674972 RepID=UPI001F2F627C|nr:MDR family MFS transporter [Microaerobacter geothermalis]MCF6093592.1 MFS transporter [Microaerobacter geothermalis]
MLYHLDKRQKITIMGAIVASMLFASLNQTIIGTALPRIVAELGGMDYYSWLFTIYMLTSSITVILVGKLSDMYGRRPFMLVGLFIFILGSFLSGTSQTIFQLILYRGIQGLGAGMIMSTSFTAIGDLFSAKERGKWQGVMGAVFGLSSIIGPAFGGYIVDYWNWEWVFWVNLPIGILAFILILKLFPKTSGEKGVVDYWGSTFLVITLVPILLAFSWAGTKYDWNSYMVIGLFASAFIGLILFIIAEQKVQSPVIPLSLFRNRIYAISNLVGFLIGIGMFGTIIYIPLFVQGVLGTSATESGFILTPMMLSMVAASTISGQITSRTGKYKILALIGVAVMGVGIYLLSVMNVNTTNGEVVLNMIITGFGLGTTMPVFVLAVQNALPQNLLGVVTASNQLFRQLGGTVGVSIMGTVLAQSMVKELKQAIPTEVAPLMSSSGLAELNHPQALLDPEKVNAMQGTLPAEMIPVFQQILAAVREALSNSLNDVFLFGFIIIVISFVLTLLLREVPLRENVSKEIEEDIASAKRPATES